jgi:hypothetical protein
MVVSLCCVLSYLRSLACLGGTWALALRLRYAGIFSHVVGVGSHRIDTTRRFVFSTNRRNGGPLTSVPCAQMDNYQ